MDNRNVCMRDQMRADRKWKWEKGLQCVPGIRDWSLLRWERVRKEAGKSDGRNKWRWYWSSLTHTSHSFHPCIRNMRRGSCSKLKDKKRWDITWRKMKVKGRRKKGNPMLPSSYTDVGSNPSFMGIQIQDKWPSLVLCFSSLSKLTQQTCSPPLPFKMFYSVHSLLQDLELIPFFAFIFLKSDSQMDPLKTGLESRKSNSK